MIRYIYIGDQISKGGTSFAFFDTVTDSFVSFAEETVFESVEEFKHYYKLDSEAESKAGSKRGIDRYLSLLSTIKKEKQGNVTLPNQLTHANGAKALLIGEFHQKIVIDNPDYCGCGKCHYCIELPCELPTKVVDVPIEWDIIKEIYNKIVTELEVT
ncbi:hypothetical protein AB832_07790 [Flavobacteriaceae bacterium (ex Bugula neritina AB1)]|nr:hypothetical protein AB832_07790 [Flavobacteriaceae bacterium (ex Bugula neritina AB1)]